MFKASCCVPATVALSADVALVYFRLVYFATVFGSQTWDGTALAEPSCFGDVVPLPAGFDSQSSAGPRWAVPDGSSCRGPATCRTDLRGPEALNLRSVSFHEREARCRSRLLCPLRRRALALVRVGVRAYLLQLDSLLAKASAVIRRCSGSHRELSCDRGLVHLR